MEVRCKFTSILNAVYLRPHVVPKSALSVTSHFCLLLFESDGSGGSLLTLDNWFASISAVRLSHQARLAHAPILVRRPYAETQQSPPRWPALAAYLVYHAFRAPSGFFLAAHTDLRARDLSPKLLFPLVRLLAASMVPPIHSTRALSFASSFCSILCLYDASSSQCAA